MKRFVLFLLSCSIGLVSAYAQPNADTSHRRKGEEKIKALYIAYMTQELQLSEEEAQKFWPIHRQFDSEMKALHKESIKDELDREEQALSIKKKYREKFIKAIGADRTQKFFKKDVEFRMRLFEKIKNHRKSMQPGGGMPPRKRRDGNPPPPPPQQ